MACWVYCHVGTALNEMVVRALIAVGIAMILLPRVFALGLFWDVSRCRFAEDPGQA